MSARQALRNPSFRRYYVGAIAAVNGNWVFRVLLSWLAWDLTHSPTFVGLVAAASLAPVALTAPLFGALADRSNLLVAYRLVTLALLICPAALLSLMLTGSVSPPSVLAVSLLFGVTLSAYHPVRQSLGPRLVDPPLIGSVVALAALNFNVGRLLSPAIGGFMISHFGVTVAASVSTALFVPALLIAPSLSPRPSANNGVRKSFLSDLKEGLNAGWRQLPVRNALLLTVVALGPVRAVTEILALIADGSFGQGAAGLGLLTSAVGGGALIAALFQVLVPETVTRSRTMRFGTIFMGFSATAMMVSAPAFYLAIVLAVPIGFAGTFIGVSLQISLQERLDDALRGRIMSLWMLSITLSTSVLAFVISALSEFTSIGWATALVLSVAAITVALIARPR